MTDEPFSAVQMAQFKRAMKEVVEESLSDAGLRIETGDHQDEARRDFMFLRTIRKGANGIAAKIGWLIIAAVLAGLYWVFQIGLAAWNKGG